MKIVFIGGVKFSYEILKTILENGIKIEILFTYNESKKEIYSDFAEFEKLSKKYRIKHIKVNNINDEKNVEFMKECKPDLLLVMGWSQILKNKILKIPRLGVIGSHPTELPRFRGRAPIPWSIIKELKESALTFFYMEEGIDDGDILDQQKFKITNKDNASSLYDKITKIGKKMILKNISLLEKGKINRKKQDSSKFEEYWEKRTPDDGKIDWGGNAKDIDKLIRATGHPYPGAFTFFNNSKIIIWKSSYNNKKKSEVGKILDIKNDFVEVGCKEGTIKLEKISVAGKELNINKFFKKEHVGKIMN